MKNKDKQNKSIEDLTYDILGNAFVGNLFDISNDIDNTSQNLVSRFRKTSGCRTYNRTACPPDHLSYHGEYTPSGHADHVF